MVRTPLSFPHYTLYWQSYSSSFFRKTKEGRTASLWFARVALLFFVLSSLGPFSLGYLMANGLGQSQWYYFSIYYYLHFQYNGFFLFGVFSLFLHVLERKQIVYDHQLVKMIGQWLAVACVPTYLLSVLWAKPGVIYNIVGGLAGLMQLYAVALLITVLKKIPIRHQFTKPSRFLLTFAFLALVLKILLQLFSSFPIISAMAYELKPIVIAYLHLVLIGVISVMILAWYFEMNFINLSGSKILPLFLTAFIATQTGLILQPWWGNFSSIAFLTASEYLLLFSTLLSLSCFLLFYCSNARKLI